MPKTRALLAVTLLGLVACAEPLTPDQQDFVGLWKNSETSLLITTDGRLDYQSHKGAADASLSAPITLLTEDRLEAGFWFFSGEFELGGRPVQENGSLVLVVDGEKLFKSDAAGRLPQATRVPSLGELRTLVMEDLRRLARSINEQDFSGYLAASSMMLQSRLDNAQMLEAFSEFIDQKIDLNPYMAGDFALTAEPGIDENGVLRVQGRFPTRPTSLKFRTSFVYAHPHWKSVGTSIQVNDQ